MTNRTDYDGIIALDGQDLLFEHVLKQAMSYLDGFVIKTEGYEINEIIELYNITKILSTPELKDEVKRKYSEKIRGIEPEVAKFFMQMTDEQFVKYEGEVTYKYLLDFWRLFEKYKCFNRISKETIKNFLEGADNDLVYPILEQKNTVKFYDDELTSWFICANGAAEFLIFKYLERHDEADERKIHIPKSIKATDHEKILYAYIESENPDIGKLSLIEEAPREFIASNKLRKQARLKAKLLREQSAQSASFYEWSICVRFSSIPETVSVSRTEDNKYCYEYNSCWIKQNLDFPTLLNNFIYLFGYTDLQMRSAFPSNPNMLGVFEKNLGIKGKKQYDTGVYYQFEDLKSSLQLQGYIMELERNGVVIEDIIAWFFNEYLAQEFEARGFVYNIPSKDSTYLEKCKLLPTEMDGVLKQFNLYVEDGAIDRELLEMSSVPLGFGQVPSLLKKKYAYISSNEVENECVMLFSDQSHLIHTKKYGSGYRNFVDLIKRQAVKKEDYLEFIQPMLEWLRCKGSIDYSDDGEIQLIENRVNILKDFYYHQVVCVNYMTKYNSTIEKMVEANEIEYESTLFSRPEQKYLNFMLNKAEYGNGLDLRNKYIHGSYPQDETTQKNDYIRILKIVILLIIKLNEEFCLSDMSIT